MELGSCFLFLQEKIKDIIGAAAYAARSVAACDPI
jgi:hypothetical protein